MLLVWLVHLTIVNALICVCYLAVTNSLRLKPVGLYFSSIRQRKNTFSVIKWKLAPGILLNHQMRYFPLTYLNKFYSTLIFMVNIWQKFSLFKKLHYVYWFIIINCCFFNLFNTFLYFLSHFVFDLRKYWRFMWTSLLEHFFKRIFK